MKLERIL